MIKIGGYYGGKEQAIKRLLAHLPLRSTIVSPFCGYGSLEMNYGAKNLILSDANLATVAALKTVRDECRQLVMWLNATDWDQSDFEACKKTLQRANKASSYPKMFELGYASIAHSGMAFQRGGSMSGYSPGQAARSKKRDWRYLFKTSKYLQTASILHRDFRYCLSKDFINSLPRYGEDNLYYLDPPYIDGGEHYQTTMEFSDHEDMLEMAIACPCAVAISGYASELYDRRLRDWKRVEFPAQNNHRQKRTEVLWVKE